MLHIREDFMLHDDVVAKPAANLNIQMDWTKLVPEALLTVLKVEAETSR